MRRVAVFSVDLFLIALSTICAIILRDNLDVFPEHFVAAVPYLAATLLASLVVAPLLRLPHQLWRFSALNDYLRLTAASGLIVVAAVAMTFAYNRLDGVARTLPLIQFNLMVCLLVGGRVLRRLQHQAPATAVATLPQIAQLSAENILIVGLNRLADLYIRSASEFAPLNVRIAGILDDKAARHGSLIRQFPILGKPEHIDQVVRELAVHGVAVRRIVVARRFSSLSAIAQQALLQLEASSDIKLDFLSERLGFEGSFPTSNDTREVSAQRFAFSAAEIEQVRARPIWRLKRVIDIVFASLASIVSAPLMILIAVLVAIDVGVPISFWQQRPGRAGIPLTVYKFRTMRSAHNDQGRIITETERTSPIGRFIRRTRLDELPQLFSILTGDMSFVGPRPLLPKDQPAQYAARLIVRPGLTGWAQVNGGRDVSAEDKAALDVWYVQNASLALDAKIVLRTIPMILFGERLRKQDIQRAWLELRRDGIATHLPIDVNSETPVLSNRRAA